MNILYAILIGYSFGCISPAALISKIKHKNIRETGTQNLGATNVMLNFGKRFGVPVMLFDVAKAFAACILAKYLLQSLSLAGIIAGCAAVFGHIFPFYLKFKGGKGLAAFGGMVLANNPYMFLIIFAACLILLLIVNNHYIFQYTASALYPILILINTRDINAFAICALTGVLVMYGHLSNLKKRKNDEQINIRHYIKTKLFKKSNLTASQADVSDGTEIEE